MSERLADRAGPNAAVAVATERAYPSTIAEVHDHVFDLETHGFEFIQCSLRAWARALSASTKLSPRPVFIFRRVELGGAAHHQPRHVGDGHPTPARDQDRQRPDRARLTDNKRAAPDLAGQAEQPLWRWC